MKKLIILHFLFLLVLATFSRQAQAQSTWQVTSGTWSTPGNWSGNAVPTSSSNAYIDNSGTAIVSVGVSGSASNLYVGNSGTGTLSFTGGSVTDSGAGYIGENAGSTGTATISSGTWSNTGELRVGDFGTGTLSITGGSVTDNTVYIGANATSTGTAAISSGTWDSGGGSFYVGFAGTGALTITGGYVTDLQGFIGSGGPSNGTVTISSGTWNNTASLQVGVSGTGVLNITGGSVTDQNAIIGVNTSSSKNDAATVSSGTWSNTGSLVVAEGAPGTLSVTGGSVTDSTGYVGYGATSSGTATVTSGTWNNTSSLQVGLSGTGTLNIKGSGVVNINSGAGTLTLGLNAGSLGTLNLGDGATAGTLNAAVITGGAGTAVVNINEPGTYIAPQLTGSLSLNQLGPGTTILSASNSYTGLTNVTGGALQVDGDITSSSLVLVTTGGTLQGTGKVTAVGVSNGGTLVIGDDLATIKSLSTGSVDLESSATFTLKLNTTTSQSDILNVSGNVTLKNANLNLIDIASSSSLLALGTQLPLIYYTGSETGVFDFNSVALAEDSTFTFGANTFKIDYDYTGSKVILTKVVPEPSSTSLLGLAGSGLLLFRLRRRLYSIFRS